MNEFKGTPGPWVAEQDIRFDSFEGEEYIAGMDVRSESGVEIIGCEGINGGGLEEQANAWLIAAAPNLLSDLKEAAQLLRNYEKLHRAKGTEDGLIKADRNRAWAEQFEATIAKATSNSN